MTSSPRELLLASTSPARRALMDALGIAYRAVSPDVDEDLPPGTPARDAVALLALRKAQAVLARHPGALVLGADQLVQQGGQVFGKPADRAAARAQLRRFCGNTHEIVTGVCLLGDGVPQPHLEVARLTFHPLSDTELERYLDLEEWRGCAGGYRIESAGQALLSSLDGDRTNVQGLPMLLVVRLLRAAGVPFFSAKAPPAVAP